MNGPGTAATRRGGEAYARYIIASIARRTFTGRADRVSFMSYVLAGAQTCTPGLTALREASESNIGSLASTVPDAIGNILLTIWRPVAVAIVHAMRG